MKKFFVSFQLKGSRHRIEVCSLDEALRVATGLASMQDLRFEMFSNESECMTFGRLS